MRKETPNGIRDSLVDSIFCANIRFANRTPLKIGIQPLSKW